MEKEKLNKQIFKKFFAISIIFVLVLGLSGCGSGKSGEKKTRFQKPNIKNSFCGVMINYQYCKCAFHNEFCDSIGLSSGTANRYVRNEYDRWVDYLRKEFDDACLGSNGINYAPGKCKYCKAPLEKRDNACVDVSDEEDEDGEEFQADGPFNNNCDLKTDKFNNEWKKYSNINDDMPFKSKSWESQKTLEANQKIINLKVENFKLQRDMEIDRQIRLEVRDYRKKLVRNQLNNVVKAFIRMTYITYSTINSGSSAGKSFSKFLTDPTTIASVGNIISTVKTVVPNDSRLAIDTNSATGKVTSVGLNVAISAMENLGNPVEIAKTFMTESRNAVMPSADFSPEEIAILRDQHIVKQHIDFALAESYKENAKRQKQLNANKNQIIQLEAELNAWEEKEKERIKNMLQAQCLTDKKNYENK